jgi:class 3 adenylate cyclase
MEKLSTFDIAENWEEFAHLCVGRRSGVAEIAQLQDTLLSLTSAIGLFSRFVPESVVQRIVHGERRATRLYVDRRCVTIMFSDIQAFTSMSEQLARVNPRQLLFLLTRYFSIMTHIAELYEGTVGEILGDGLLIFWNTPNNVRHHATKAAACALAQQHALLYLNQHFASMGLPELEIRIGIHTGQVLTGNIGSFTKMKFGCMGDPVNLASRLEGLCKEYGVGVICSGKTHKAFAPNHGFLCRKLDTVRVMGRNTPTEVFEIIGRDEVRGWQSAPVARGSKSFEALTTAVSEPAHSRAKLQIPRIQDVVAEAIDGLIRLRKNRGTVGAGSLWEHLDHEEAPPFGSVSIAARNIESLTVTDEQKARAAKYEEADQAFKQGMFSAAYQLACEILEETPGDRASLRLRDKANEHYQTQETMPNWSTETEESSRTPAVSRSLAELAVTQMHHK